MTERISAKVIDYLEKYPQFIKGVHSATEAGNLFRGYFNLVEELMVNPELPHSQAWRSLELTARNRAQEVLEKTSLTLHDTPKLNLPHLEINPKRRQVIIEGKPKFLSPSQFLILSILSEHSGQVITAQDLARELEKRLKPEQYYDSAKMPTGHIPTLIQRLRRALGDPPKSPRFIKNVPRFGYTLISYPD